MWKCTGSRVNKPLGRALRACLAAALLHRLSLLKVLRLALDWLLVWVRHSLRLLVH